MPFLLFHVLFPFQILRELDITPDWRTGLLFTEICSFQQILRELSVTPDRYTFLLLIEICGRTIMCDRHEFRNVSTLVRVHRKVATWRIFQSFLLLITQCEN